MSKIQLKTATDIIVHIPNEEWTNPCWIAYLDPYVFVIPDDERPWKIDIEEINNVSYNYSKLLRVVTKVKVAKGDLDALICYDGTIALPRHGRFLKKECAIQYFNELFLTFNLNGFFVGYVDHKDVLHGRLEDKWAIHNYQIGNSTVSQLHSKNRWGQGSNMDSVHLDIPRILRVSELHEIINRGRELIERMPNLSTKFLNVGITEIRYKNWDAVLSNLWITAEQVIDHLWHTKFLKSSKYHPQEEVAGRKASMKDDNRTWSASIKQELLFQSKIITEEILKCLFEARRNRNKLVHEGKSVSKETAWNLFYAVSELLKITFDKNHSLFFKEEAENSLFDEFYNPENSSFDDWKSLPNDNIIESALGAETTINIKIDKSK